MNNFSFKYKFILTFVIVEIFFILLIVGMNFISINNATEKLIKKEITTTKYLLESLIKLPISVYDLATLDDITKQSTVGSLNSIIIFDINNTPLSKNYNINTSYEKLSKIDITKNNEIFEKDNRYIIDKLLIKEEDILVGSAFLIFDTNDIDKQIEKNKQNVFFIILIEILISTLIAYFLGRNLTKKLSNLTKMAKKIGNEEEIEILYEKDRNELAILNNSITKMYEDINLRNEKLKEAKIVFDNITEAIIFLDEKKQIISANNSFFKITKFDEKEVRGNNLFKLLNLNEEEIDYSEKNDIKIKINNNDYLNILLNINTVYDEIKNTKNYIVLFVDITKERKKEDLLQIQSKMATMGEMISNIAHQWRQPLSAISTISSTVKIQSELDLLPKEELHQSLDNIIKSVRYLSETIDDFRNFFKVEKEIKEFEISELFDSLKKILSARITHNEITLNINKLNYDIHVIGLKNELIQSLINIINNAIDAIISNNIAKGIVDINIKEVDDFIEIEIQDNAGGIPQKVLNKIFEPYFTTKHQSQGTGIGLYMTHTIITQHCKGKIDATNRNSGALFTITIPKELS